MKIVFIKRILDGLLPKRLCWAGLNFKLKPYPRKQTVEKTDEWLHNNP